MCAVAAAGAGLSSVASAQALKRVAVLFFTGSPRPEFASVGFPQGMRELGYLDGRNVVIDYRYADGRPERLAGLAAELVQARPDVIVTGGPGPLSAVRHATSTIPIVTVGGSDPVGESWAQSLAHPGGQVTGLLVTVPEIDAKRLELLKEALPEVVRVAVMLAPVELMQQGRDIVERLEGAARRLGLQLQWFETREPGDIDTALRRARENRAQAVLTVDTPFIVGNRGRLVEAAARERLAACSEFAFVGIDGLVMAYGADLNDLLRRAAAHVDRILKGARPGDLPIELPTKFDLTVNLKTARALGLTVQPAFLLRADRVVE